MRRNIICAFALALSAMAPGQIIINEVHGFGQGAAPALPGDYLEIWNQGATSYDLAGHVISIWSGDTGMPASVTIPTCPNGGNSIVPANGFWVFQQGIANLGQALTGTLAGLNGMQGFLGAWSESSNMGCRILDPAGNCVDYVHLRRGTSSLPATPPNLPVGCTWILGNVSASGTGRGHIQRLTNFNTNSFADWEDNVTATVGTPGQPNTIGNATQIPTGPVGASGIALAFESNAPDCSFDVNGATGFGIVPVSVAVCVNGAATANFGSTNLGMPWDLALTASPLVAGPSSCGGGGGGIRTAGGQQINFSLTDPTLVWRFGFTFVNLFTGNFTLPINTSNPLALIAGQMVILDNTNPDGFALSAPTQLTIEPFETRILTLGDNATTNVDLTTLCGFVGSVPFYGTTYTSLWVNSNGRVMFGPSGDTDPSPTLLEALNDNPSVGLWTDWDPAASGSGNVTVSSQGGLVTVSWNSVFYAGTTTPSTFNVAFNPASGEVTINTPGVLPNPTGVGVGDAQLLGISGGFVNGATLTLGINFTTGVSGFPLIPTHMLYDFWNGLAGGSGAINMVPSLSLSAGVLFTPSGNTYGYIGL